MRISLYGAVLVAAFVLLASPLEAKMSDGLAKFMEKSMVAKYCKKQGWSDDKCIMYLKKLCGMQDVSDPKENAELEACTRREVCGRGLAPQQTGNRTVRQKLQFSWKKKHMSYFVYNTPPQTTLTKGEIETMTHMSFAVWSCYTELTFRKAKTLEEADVIVMFSEPTHSYYSTAKDQVIPGSDGSPFDGKGGVLAHAFYPIGDHLGNLHMDNAEKWSANMHPGALNTFTVLVHELGHSLGLPHSKADGDIMAPFYQGRIREADLDLGSWEKSAIQSLYGAKACTDKRWQKHFAHQYPKKDGSTGYQPKPPKRPTSTTDASRCEIIHPSACKTSDWVKANCKDMCARDSFVKRSTSGNKAHVCKKGSLHSIFDFVDGFTYIISDGFLYRRNNAAGHIDMSFRRKVSSLWKGAPAKPSAAVYSRAAKRLFLFQGKDVFIISGLKGSIKSKGAKVKRVTVNTPKYPASPSAAFIKFDDRDSGNVHLVKGSKVFVFSTSKREVVKSIPFKALFEVGGYKNRIPRKVDGAYHLFKADSMNNPADSLFFFTGSSYTLAIPDKKTGKYNIPSGTAAFSTSYLHCPQK